MNQRRSLVEGVKQNAVDPAIESAFVFSGTTPKPDPTPPQQAPSPIPAVEAREGKGQTAGQLGRAPLTIRFRSDFAAALKRASLQRQLDGESPNTLQDILEEAVEPWLRANGYLT